MAVTLPIERLQPADDWNYENVNYVQTKYDGHRLTLYKTGGKLYALARTQELSSRLTDCSWFKLVSKVADETIIDGEMIVPDQPNSAIPTALKEDPTRLDFKPFAVPLVAGVSWVESGLNVPYEFCRNLGLGFGKWREFRYMKDSKDSLLADARKLGIEGYVLKAFNYQGWYKLKPTWTADLIVTGFEMSEAKTHKGMVAALLGSAYVNGKLTEVVKCGGGFTLADRAAINTTSDLGRIFEVEYQTIGSRGRLIHPRFIRWRDDKPAEECVLKRRKK